MESTERFDARYFILSCGDGASLEYELAYKLKLVRKLYATNIEEFKFYSIVALTSIYGVDDSSLMVKRCRKALYNRFIEEVADIANLSELADSIHYILSQNIICADVEGLAIVDNDNQPPIELPIWDYAAGKILRTDYLLSELLERTYAIDINLFQGYDGEITLTAPIRKHRPHKPDGLNA